jgi:hypothetical protein
LEVDDEIAQGCLQWQGKLCHLLAELVNHPQSAE